MLSWKKNSDTKYFYIFKNLFDTQHSGRFSNYTFFKLKNDFMQIFPHIFRIFKTVVFPTNYKNNPNDNLKIMSLFVKFLRYLKLLLYEAIQEKNSMKSEKKKKNLIQANFLIYIGDLYHNFVIKADWTSFISI